MTAKFGERLIAAGRVSAADVEQALEEQGFGGADRLGDQLVAAGKLSAVDLAKTVAEHFDLPYVELPTIESGIFALAPVELQQQHRMVPFADDGAQLSVAVAEPLDPESMARVQRLFQRPVRLFIASAEDIDAIHHAATDSLLLTAEPASEVQPAELISPKADTVRVIDEGAALPQLSDLFHEESAEPTATSESLAEPQPSSREVKLSQEALEVRFSVEAETDLARLQRALAVLLRNGTLSWSDLHAALNEAGYSE